LSVAYSPTLGSFEVDYELQTVVDEAVGALGTAGAVIEEHDPAVIDWDAAYSSLLTGLEVVFASFAADLKRTAGIDLLARGDEIDPHVLDRIRAGQKVTAVAYKQANVARTELFDAFQTLFETYDLLVTPTVAAPPFKSADGPPEEINGHPLERPHDLALTWPINLTGHPAVSVPAGFVDGLPVGLQLIGRRFDDKTVLAAAARLEATAPWADQYPIA
jgi:aspartyl-tRNA(Asn)/glutamyl-tRNA(Gln) amidotransferase subunit A